MNGEVPLYKGAKVTKNQTYGANTMVELDVAATPQEVMDFYGREMPGKGWTAGPAKVHGPKGMATFIQSNRQLAIKVVEQGERSKITMSIITY
jgi:hypothetical protein